MKRLFFFTVLLMSILIYGTTFAGEPIKGKLFSFTGKITFDKDDTNAYFIEDKSIKTIGVISGHELGDATQEFLRCLGDGKYKGVVEITAMVDFIFQDERRLSGNGAALKIDKSSICNRVDKKSNINKNERTGKAKRDLNTVVPKAYY